jgi:hypothetical protein
MANDPVFSEKQEMDKRAQSILNLGNSDNKEHWQNRSNGAANAYDIDKNAPPQTFQEMLASFVTPGSSQLHVLPSQARLAVSMLPQG